MLIVESPAPVPQGHGPLGLGPLGLGPLGLGPLGQVRIYLGSAYRFIWPVHLAGWLELGWTTEPMATPGATPLATRTPSRTRRSNKEKNLIEVNHIEINPFEPNPISEIRVGVGSATADEPLPVLVTDFLVDPSAPTDA